MRRHELTSSNNESMSYMNRVVHTESYGQDNIDTGDDVNSDVPEVEEPNDVG